MTNDSLDLHPTNICNRCRCRLGRATKNKESTVADQFQNRHKLFVFEPHKSNKSCLICQSQRGRPKKIPPADSVQECRSSSSTDSCSDETGSSTGFKVGNNDEPLAKKIALNTTTADAKRSDLHIFTMLPTVKSISLDRFVTVDGAQTFFCSLCQGVPSTDPVQSCNHIYCGSCLKSWISNVPTCPVCRDIIDIFDVGQLDGHLLDIYNCLNVKCCNQNCKVTYKMSQLQAHERSCASLTTIPIYIVPLLPLNL